MIPTPPVFDPRDGESLADSLARLWQQGNHLPVEDFLALHEVQNQPEIAVPLIYEEMSLRRERGWEASPEEYFKRFPFWRRELEMLFLCHELFDDGRLTAPRFPETGDVLGEFHLVAELGRGSHGRVFLATQAALADRHVVLKLTPRTGCEHLSLARLQHTNILPLLFVQEDEARDLLLLCMPYYGGLTLAQILGGLPDQRLRTGRQLLEQTDAAGKLAPIGQSIRAPARRLLQQASAVQAVCWVGACLADALHYAHEQGLIHLDVKPSNVLLTAGGQPLLLDFHLAREPLLPQNPLPFRLGGTPAYMAPEHRAAFAAVGKSGRCPTALDGRADVYSLGLVLCEMLGGPITPVPNPPEVLARLMPDVPPGLRDILARCLRSSPNDRYPTAANLATDLRRQLADLPLVGVRNRSLLERWRKWRRRRPHGLVLAALLALMVTVTGAATVLFILHQRQQRETAETALVDGRRQLREQRHNEALATLRRGQVAIEALPGNSDLKALFAAEVDQAAQAQVAQDLHDLAERMRFLFGSTLPPGRLRLLEQQCGQLWGRRQEIQKRLPLTADPALREQVQADFLDLAILWTDLRVRLASAEGAREARRQAMEILDHAEELFGASPVLIQERRVHAQALGLLADARPVGLSARTPWESYALGRSLLRCGWNQEAAPYLSRAVQLQPQGFWPNYYHGVCAYRLGRHQEAVMAFSACTVAKPERAEVWFNRAVALGALECSEQSLRDYDEALRLDPTMAPAALNRGLLHFRHKRYRDAKQDLESALYHGAEAAPVHCNLALVHLAQKDHQGALVHVRRALQADPQYQEARQLLSRFDLSP